MDSALRKGIRHEVPISFGGMSVLLGFLVIDGLWFGVIVGHPTLETLQVCIDLGTQQVKMKIAVKRFILVFNCARVVFPDETKFIQIAMTLHRIMMLLSMMNVILKTKMNWLSLWQTRVKMILATWYHLSTFLLTVNKESCFFSKLSHVPEKERKGMMSWLQESNVFSWSLIYLRLADSSVPHSFELAVDKPIYFRARRVSPKHNELVRKETDLLLKASIITLSASAWSFLVVIASK